MSCPPDKIIFDEERGEYICTETGEVIEERVVDQGADWRAFTPEERIERERVGSPLIQTVHDLGITTEIGLDKMTYDDGRRMLEAIKLMKIQRDARLKSANRTIVKGLQEIERLSSLLKLPKAVKNEAAVIFKKAYEKGLVRGRSVDAIVAASIYASCRIMKVTKTIDEIAKCTDVEKQKIEKYYRLLFWSLKLNIQSNGTRDYIIKFGNELCLSTKTLNSALEFEEKIRDKLIGKDPKSVASALLYISAKMNDENITQAQIKKVTGVTEVTIRVTYKEIVEILNLNVKV